MHGSGNLLSRADVVIWGWKICVALRLQSLPQLIQTTHILLIIVCINYVRCSVRYDASWSARLHFPPTSSPTPLVIGPNHSDRGRLKLLLSQAHRGLQRRLAPPGSHGYPTVMASMQTCREYESTHIEYNAQLLVSSWLYTGEFVKILFQLAWPGITAVLQAFEGIFPRCENSQVTVGCDSTVTRC